MKGNCEFCQKPHTWGNSMGRFCSALCKNRTRQLTRDQWAEKKARVAARRDAVCQIKLERGCESEDCRWTGEFHPGQLDFDHLNPADKLSSVSYLLGSGASMETVLAEIAVCRVLCANCHRLHTAQAQNHYQIIPPEM